VFVFVLFLVYKKENETVILPSLSPPLVLAVSSNSLPEAQQISKKKQKEKTKKSVPVLALTKNLLLSFSI